MIPGTPLPEGFNGQTITTLEAPIHALSSSSSSGYLIDSHMDIAFPLPVEVFMILMLLITIAIVLAGVRYVVSLIFG